MNEMNKPEITEDIVSYFRIQAEILQLKAVRQSSVAGAAIFATVFFTALIALFLIMISVGVALLISDWLQSYYLGFFITGGILLVKILLFYLFRESLIFRPIKNRIIQSFFEGENKNTGS